MKTIITSDKANKPYGYPQLDSQGRLNATGSLLGTAATASYFSGSISNAVFANTASFATTSELLQNPQIITNNINIPANYNALLVGPVDFSGSVVIGLGSNLTIL